jgi:hypothetical protein
MKSAFRFFLCLGFVIFFTGFTNLVPTKRTGSKIEVYFSNKLDLADPVRLKAELSQKEIKLTYQRLIFDKDDKLSGISFTVRSEGLYCGSGETNNLSREYGFYIDKSPEVPVYFAVGLTR